MGQEKSAYVASEDKRAICVSERVRENVTHRLCKRVGAVRLCPVQKSRGVAEIEASTALLSSHCLSLSLSFSGSRSSQMRDNQDLS